MAAPYRIRRPQVGLTKAAAVDHEGFKLYLDRLMKLIPAEVVGLYLIGAGFIPEGQSVALVVWACVGLAGVVVVRAYGTADAASALPTDWVHVAISCVAYAIWVYTLGGPFAAYHLYLPWVGSVMVLVWTFFSPYVYKGPPD